MTSSGAPRSSSSGTTADPSKAITDAMGSSRSPNFAVIFSVRDDEHVAGWLGFEKDMLRGMIDFSKANGSEFCEPEWIDICTKARGYYTESFYDAKELKDRLTAHTLSADDAVSGLRESAVNDIVESMGKLAAKLGEYEQWNAKFAERLPSRPFSGEEEDALKKIATALGKSDTAAVDDLVGAVRDKVSPLKEHIETQARQLHEEINALKETVRLTVEQAREQIQTGHVTAPTSATPPNTHQPGGEGHQSVSHTDAGHEWSFGMVLVDSEDGNYVLPTSEDAHHWRINKGEKIHVKRVEGSEGEKETAADDNFSFSSLGKDPDIAAVVKSLLDDHGGTEKWYPQAGAPTDKPAPASHRPGGAGHHPVSDFVDVNGLKWTFDAVMVNEDGKRYMHPDEEGAHHWRLAKGQTILVKNEDEGTQKETAAPADIDFDAGKDLADPAIAAAINKLLSEAGAENPYYPPTAAAQREQQAAEEDARKRAEGSAKMKNQLRSLQESASGLRRFMPRHLSTLPRNEIVEQNTKWAAFIGAIGALVEGDVQPAGVTARITEGRALLKVAVDKGGDAPPLADLKDLLDELEAAMPDFERAVTGV